MPEVRVSAEDVCDFCSETNPSRTFDCPDFPMDPAQPDLQLPEYRSRGAWMACSTCGAMIDSGRWDDLLNRATAALGRKYALPGRLLRETVKRSHDLFRKHWRGAHGPTTEQHGN